MEKQFGFVFVVLVGVGWFLGFSQIQWLMVVVILCTLLVSVILASASDQIVSAIESASTEQKDAVECLDSSVTNAIESLAPKTSRG